MRKVWLIALLCGSLVCALSADSHARGRRGGRRGGVVMGPFGPLYDTRSPEWRMSGGNIFAYQQLMRVKMEMQREQLMLKQMQRAQKLQKARDKNKNKGKGKDETRPKAGEKASERR